MKLGIMQPYFFPYVGYFELIRQTDLWIVFDTAQYIRHGWINRNRILHPSSSWQYIIVPTESHAQKTPISDIRIASDPRWRDRLFGQLRHYEKRATFYRSVLDLVSTCLVDPERSLCKLNVDSLAKVCEYLRIPFRYLLFSEMDLSLGPVEEPGDWALRISEALGATEYVNPPGGIDLFDRSKFDAAHIALTIQQPSNFIYECDGYQFEPNLSIIDVLMWNSPAMVNDYFLLRQGENRC